MKSNDYRYHSPAVPFLDFRPCLVVVIVVVQDQNGSGVSPLASNAYVLGKSRRTPLSTFSPCFPTVTIQNHLSGLNTHEQLTCTAVPYPLHGKYSTSENLV